MSPVHRRFPGFSQPSRLGDMAAPNGEDRSWPIDQFKGWVKTALLELEKPNGVNINKIYGYLSKNQEVKKYRNHRRYVREALAQMVSNGEVFQSSSRRYIYIQLNLIQEAPKPHLPPGKMACSCSSVLLRALREMNKEDGSDLESILKYVEDTYSKEEVCGGGYKFMFPLILESMVKHQEVVISTSYKLADKLLKPPPAEVDELSSVIDLTGLKT